MGTYYSSLDKWEIYPYEFDGKVVTSDYTFTEGDYAVGVLTSGGEVVLTVPTASTIVRYPRCWVTKKMSSDSNRVIIKLQTPSDSMYGAEFYSMKLEHQGSGIKIVLNANGQYTFADWGGTTEFLSTPIVTTQTPSEAGGTLTMNGSVDDMGAETSVYAYFRYRDVTAGGSWIETTKNTKTTTGAYSDTATVTTGNTFEVQAMVEIIATGSVYYGAVLRTTSNYYHDTNEAMNDGLVAYWPLQESAGTDTTGSETINSKDMSFYNGVTIASDTINSHTIYKRVFGTSDYGQSSFTPYFSMSDYTILIQISNANTSGDHTMLNFGRNILSIGSDTTSIQLEVNGYISTWSSSQPLSMSNLFITVNRSGNRSRIYTATSSAATLRTTNSRVPNNDAVYTRVADGSAGDANHQSGEYLDNGNVRSIAVWKRVLTTSEMVDISNTLDTDGELIVT